MRGDKENKSRGMQMLANEVGLCQGYTQISIQEESWLRCWYGNEGIIIIVTIVII